MSHQINNKDCYRVITEVIASDGTKKIELKVTIQQKVPKTEFIVYVKNEIKLITNRLDNAVSVYNEY